MAQYIDAAGVASAARDEGISVFRLASVRRIGERLDRAARMLKASSWGTAVLSGLASFLPDPIDGSFLACAFPYACDQPEDRGEAPPPGSAGLVAPFARSNYYRAAVLSLKAVVRRLGETAGVMRRGCRIFVNSRLPEKLIACGAGLGVYGRNRLLFTEEYGSRFIIGLLFFPGLPAEESECDPPPAPDEHCGGCTACHDACPVNALRSGHDLADCLKARSDAFTPWDDDIRRLWGLRFYGCDTCQAVCPKNRRAALHPPAPLTLGAVGPHIDLASFLSLNEEEIRARFKRTALGMSWILIPALLRNALCAAGNAGTPELLPAVDRYRDDPRPLLAATARWARTRIESMRDIASVPPVRRDITDTPHSAVN